MSRKTARLALLPSIAALVALSLGAAAASTSESVKPDKKKGEAAPAPVSPYLNGGSPGPAAPAAKPDDGLSLWT
ncbi:MAG TPA: hypothetical protein VN898_10495, partial [Candidatus Binatia bacterium]|nr:hypothetical protein [Candidatus Binatia bacterium]